MVTYYGPIKEYKAKNMIKGDWEHKNRVIEYLTNTHGFLERFTHLDNVYYIITGKGVKQIKGEDTVANNGKGETVKKREKRILEYLEDSIKPKKNKEITKYLKRFEPLINYDVTYQTLRELEERGEIVDLVEPTADNKIQTETWLLAEYRNTLTGHVHYIPVESCEHAEWVLRCMNHHRKFEFVELYKKEE